MTLSAGDRLGPYEISCALGAGGMGEVYRALDHRLGRDVAIKSVRASGDSVERSRELILREARAAARLNHPNIATVHDVLETDAGAFIVMEFVDGETLSHRLARGPLPVPEAVRVCEQVADALVEAHARGIVHRDLKPGNIQVASNGAIKILDFGLARPMTPVAGPCDPTIEASLPDEVRSGISGTPAYMSPEQILGQAVGPPSDVFSFGVLAFELLTARKPFVGANLVGLASAIATAPTPDVRDHDPSVPGRVAELIWAMLAKRPAERPTAVDVKAAFSALQSGAPIVLPKRDASAEGAGAPAFASGQRRSGRSRWLLTGAAIAVLAAGAIGGWVTFGRRGGAGAASRPAVIAVTPAQNASGSARAEYFGSALTTVVTSNIGRINGLSMVAGSASLMPKDAAFVIDLFVQDTQGGFRASVRVRRPGEAGAPEQAFENTALAVQRDVLAGILSALARAGESRADVSRADRERVLQLPTSSGEAFDLYAEARTLLSRPDVPGNLERSVALFERAIATDRSFALAHAGLTDASIAMYQRTKDAAWVARATESAGRALAADPDQSGVRTAIASLRNSTGQPAEAIRELRLAVARQPGRDDTHRLLGRILAEQGQFDEAIAELKTAIALRPEFGANYNTLGWAQYNAGRYREAIEAYRKLTELQPDNPDGYQNLGACYQLIGDDEQALGHYQHAVRVGPSARAYSNMGLAYFVLGRLTDSLAAYDESVRRDPANPTTHKNLGDVRRRMGQAGPASSAYQECVSRLEKMVAVNAQDAKSIGLMAVCEVRLGRGAAGERHAAEALALAPASKDVLVRNAQVAALLGKSEIAMLHLRRAVAAGYGPSLLRGNDEFVSLQNRPDYQKLVTSSSQPASPTTGEKR